MFQLGFPILVSVAFTTLAADPTTDQLAFFEAKVRPLFVKHCYECHSADAKKVKGGLLLDSKEGWMAGGDSGDVLEPGKPNASLLMDSVRYSNKDLQMPPKYQLTEAEIAVLENWVEMGAPDPRTGARMAGGGVKGGIRYGGTDELGGTSVLGKLGTHDLHATMLHLLGFDHTKLTYRYAGRDFRLTDVYGDVAKEIIA